MSIILNQLVSDPKSAFFEMAKVDVRVFVHRKMRDGMPYEAVRQAAVARFLDKERPFLSLGSAAEYLREDWDVLIRRTIDQTLSEPLPREITEAARRRDGWTDGVPVRLANGETWIVPRLGLDKATRPLTNGKECYSYSWLRDEWGRLIYINISYMINGWDNPELIPDLFDPEPLLLRKVATILLQQHYDLTDKEAAALMPFAPDSWDDFAVLAATVQASRGDVNGGQVVDPKLEFAGGMMRGMECERIANDFRAMIKHIIEDMRKTEYNNA
jgi:hypothetical protein